MNGSCDVIVIGAGGFGCSIAHSLTAAGLSVTVVDGKGIATQTASRAAGLSGVAFGPAAFNQMQQASARAVRTFIEQTGEPLDWEPSGSLLLARTDEDAFLLERELDTARDWGVAVERCAPADLPRHSPYLRRDGVRAAMWVPEDLYFEPAQLPQGYARAAAGRGATFLLGSPVTDLIVHGGRVTGVRTANARLDAGVVIDAAGAWARRVAGQAGMPLPLFPVRHQLLVTSPLPDVQPRQPVVRVMDARVYVRPCWGGLMLGGYELDPLFQDADPPLDFDIAALTLDPAPLQELATDVEQVLPVLREAPVRLLRGGLPTMTADGLPLLGPSALLDGFLVAAGCCVAGLSISPAVGTCLAQLVATGRSEIDLTPFAPDRFSDPRWSGEELRRAARRQYAGRYREVHSGG